MRQLNRLRASIVRRPPPPRWLAPLLIAAGTLAAATVLAAGLALTVRAGLFAELARLRQDLAVWVERSLDLRVRSVETVGRRRTERADLVRMLASLETEYILTVDLNAVRQRLHDLPWVRRASVRRLLPGTILVELEEYEPAAIWLSDRGPRLIDASGEIVPVGELGAFRHLPVIAGSGAPARFSELSALLAREPTIASRVTGAALVAGRRWNLLLDSRLEIRLPDHQPEAALRRLAREQESHRILERAIEAIDLRTEDWIVVRPMKRQPENGSSGGKAA
ncbi:Cell division protein FtsQ [bacterium HR40]|nr:Cell division protein FtsQ [bacterium HR40]